MLKWVLFRGKLAESGELQVKMLLKKSIVQLIVKKDVNLLEIFIFFLQAFFDKAGIPFTFSGVEETK